MPAKVCIDCNQVATYRGRCKKHARHRDKLIVRAGTNIYQTKKWRMLRKKVLFEQPLCACGALATDVDHITPLVQGGAPYRRSNVQGLCGVCHGRKTRSEQLA